MCGRSASTSGRGLDSLGRPGCAMEEEDYTIGGYPSSSRYTTPFHTAETYSTQSARGKSTTPFRKKTFSRSTTQRISGNHWPKLSAPIRFPRWRASRVCHRNDRPSRPDGDRPFVYLLPYDGHNKGQGLFGHHSHPAGHRTLQAFYHHVPFWEAEATWGDDHRLQRVEEAT